MKLDVLVFAAHPDDAEFGCAGTIMSHVAQGYKVGVIDLTRGEMGTRGTIEGRFQEAKDASDIMDLSVRENLHFEDVFFEDDKEHRLKVAGILRKYQPEIVFCNAPEDRHPDHAKASNLVMKACFIAGLEKVETFDKSEKQVAWRPKQVFQYIQSNYLKPDFVVDITGFWDKKLECIKAFRSQIFNEKYENQEKVTFISKPEFLDFMKSRAREFGHAIGVPYGEGFISTKTIGVHNVFDLNVNKEGLL